MNAHPHIHEVKITRVFGNSGSWRIDYGDTRVNMWPWTHPFNKDKALRKKVRKAIRRHDQGSIRAGTKADITEQILVDHNSRLGECERLSDNYVRFIPARNAWGSDLMKETSDPLKETSDHGI